VLSRNARLQFLKSQNRIDMSDTLTIKDVLSEELGWAKKKLEETHAEHEALKKEFEDLKPAIRDMAAHPVVDTDRDPVDVVAEQYALYRKKALEAEQLRHKIVRFRVKRSEIVSTVTGPGGALSFSLDALADYPDLLEKAGGINNQFETHRRTGWRVFYETLEQIDDLVTDCRNEYIDKVSNLHAQLRDLEAK
jgi:hypothetical protein